MPGTGFYGRRRLRILSQRWQRRILFVAGGVAVGLAAVAFALLADASQTLFALIAGFEPYAPLVLTPGGFALSAWLTRRYFANSQGSGIPQTIAARKLPDPRDRAGLLSLRIAAGKLLLTVFGLLCGASIGREGPTVQIGASIMFSLGRLSPRRQPGLVLAGAAAGIAAAFNTPLAGIVFGIEEMSQSFELRSSGLVLGAIIAAGITAIACTGNYTYFGFTTQTVSGLANWLAIPVVGVAGGLLGGLFSLALVAVARNQAFPGIDRLRARPMLFAAGCGLLVAVCGLLSDGATFGTGYEQASKLVHGGATSGWTFLPLKFAATLLSSISGIPGGIFSPSLSIGAGLGAVLANLLKGSNADVLVLLGMVAYLTGVVQAPLTSFVIVSEMTDNHAMIIPLMAAALVAQSTSRLICKQGVYHALAANFAKTPAPTTSAPGGTGGAEVPAVEPG